MAVPACRALIERHMTLASETLEQIGKQDLLRYREQLLARFANPSIDHRCLQIAMDGSQKLPQRIFIPAMIRMERVLDVQTFALATALWFRYLTGENEQGAVIECNDPLAADLKSIVDGAGSVAERVVALGRLPGLSDPLFEKCDWVSSVAELVDKLDTEGVMDTVSTLVEHEQSR
jgi:fructuronate reductase